jgi:hypothetical protein
MFQDKSFVMIMALLMFFPALPVPSAAHLFEAIVFVIAAQMFLGRKSLWVPKFLAERVKLGVLVKSRAMGKVINRFEWLESKAGPYGKIVFDAPLVERLLALYIMVLTAAAFIAPPLSGLDTLPSMGVVLISLAILLENVFLLTLGLIIGTAGLALSAYLASAILEFLSRLF